jgi:hypothetical protein
MGENTKYFLKCKCSTGRVLPRLVHYTGKNTWRIKSNVELYRLINGADIVRLITAQGTRWLGHIQRMDSLGMAKRISERKPMGKPMDKD